MAERLRRPRRLPGPGHLRQERARLSAALPRRQGRRWSRWRIASRAERGQPTISELDGAERYSPGLHTRGDIASPLIFTASYADYLSHRPRRASTSPRSPAIRWAGTRPSPAPARSIAEHGFRIIDAMGQNSQAGEPGGQVLLSLVDERLAARCRACATTLLALVAAIDARPGARSPSRSSLAA